MDEPNKHDYKDKRRSERIYLRIPIRVSATDPKGPTFTEDCATIRISRHGACIRLKHPLSVGDTLQIENLKNDRVAAFRVVDRVSEPQVALPYADWGVETLDLEAEIWGVELRETPVEEGAFSAVLECNNCTTMSSFLLTAKEASSAGASVSAKRFCSRCQEETTWIFVALDRRQHPTPSGAKPSVIRSAPSQAGKERRAIEERRQKPRLAIQVPIRVRTPEGQEEVSTTVDLSRTGTRFLGAGDYPVGSVLSVTVPYAKGQTEIEVKASVEHIEELPDSPESLLEVKTASVKHIEELPGSPKRLYGLKFESRKG